MLKPRSWFCFGAFAPAAARKTSGKSRIHGTGGAAVICLLLLAISTALNAEGVYTLDWARQQGTDRHDVAKGLAIDPAGNVYITGYRDYYAPYPTTYHNTFLSRYTPAGSQTWHVERYASGSQIPGGVAVDSGSNVYFAGSHRTYGTSNDVLIGKCDASGASIWTRTLSGTTYNDIGTDITVDHQDYVYVCGYTQGTLGSSSFGYEDAFVAQYDSSGTRQWTQQVGAFSEDIATAVAVDNMGSVYIAGNTEGDMQGQCAGYTDGFISKFAVDGAPGWTRQFGSSMQDEIESIRCDPEGNLYVVGSTRGDIAATNAGSYDVFVRKYDPNGDCLWSRQFGTPGEDSGMGIDIGPDGGVYVTGGAYGDLGGTHAGWVDCFVTKLDASGDQLWTWQLGTPTLDMATAVLAAPDGSVYVTGYTYGDIGGPNAGEYDTFLVRLVPEPATLLMLTFGAAAALLKRRRA